MSDFTEQSIFTPTARRILTTDKVLGGANEVGGNVNSPYNYMAQSLVNRTRYLYNQLGKTWNKLVFKKKLSLHADNQIPDGIDYNPDTDQYAVVDNGTLDAVFLYDATSGAYASKWSTHGNNQDSAGIGYRDVAAHYLILNAIGDYIYVYSNTGTYFRRWILQDASTTSGAACTINSSGGLDVVQIEAGPKYWVYRYTLDNQSVGTYSEKFLLGTSQVDGIAYYSYKDQYIVSNDADDEIDIYTDNYIKLGTQPLHTDNGSCDDLCYNSNLDEFAILDYSDNQIYIYADGASPVETVPDASTTVKGIVERATQTEVNTGIDQVRFVSPETLQGKLDAFFGASGTSDVSIFDNQSIFTAESYHESGQLFGHNGWGFRTISGQKYIAWSPNINQSRKTVLATLQTGSIIQIWSNDSSDFKTKVKTTGAYDATNTRIPIEDYDTSALTNSTLYDLYFKIPSSNFTVLEKITFGSLLFLRIRFDSDLDDQSKIDISGGKWRLLSALGFNQSSDDYNPAWGSSHVTFENVVHGTDFLSLQIRSEVDEQNDIISLSCILES